MSDITTTLLKPYVLKDDGQWHGLAPVQDIADFLLLRESMGLPMRYERIELDFDPEQAWHLQEGSAA